MKRNFSKPGHRERIDKIEKKAAQSGSIKKEKSSKRKFSIYDDFDDEDLDDFNPRYSKPRK